MRRYLQGTLDFDCAIYAVINALACTHGIDLANARRIFQDTALALPEYPRLWQAVVRNETDYYWLIRHLFSRWSMQGPWRLRGRQPFGECLLPSPPEAALASFAQIPLYLPEARAPYEPVTTQTRKDRLAEASAVWDALAGWLEPSGQLSRAAVLRFHRWVPGVSTPIVSHWTTGARVQAGVLFLHDASGEKNSLHSIERVALVPADDDPLIRIVPESVILVERF